MEPQRKTVAAKAIERTEAVVDARRHKRKVKVSNMAIQGVTVGKKLVDAGLIPPDTVRLMVDINVNELVKVYYETNAGEGLIDELLAQITTHKNGVDIINVDREAK